MAFALTAKLARFIRLTASNKEAIAHLRHNSRLAVALGLVLLLTACQPSYTIERSEHYARQLGITTKFDIKRWHHRTISADSKVVIAISPQEGLASKALFQIFEIGFAPHFAHIIEGAHSSSVKKTIATAKRHRGEILLFIDPVDLDMTSDLKRAELFISLFDVNSGQIIDKVVLSARAPYYNVVGTDLNNLLKVSVQHFARQLSGV